MSIHYNSSSCPGLHRHCLVAMSDEWDGLFGDAPQPAASTGMLDPRHTARFNAERSSVRSGIPPDVVVYGYLTEMYSSPRFAMLGPEVSAAPRQRMQRHSHVWSLPLDAGLRRPTLGRPTRNSLSGSLATPLRVAGGEQVECGHGASDGRQAARQAAVTASRCAHGGLRCVALPTFLLTYLPTYLLTYLPT